MTKRSWEFFFRMPDTGAPATEEDRWIAVVPPLRAGSKTERLVPYRVQIRVEVDRERRLVCSGLRVSGGPAGVELTTRGLREIRLNEILAELAAALGRDSEWLSDQKPEPERLRRELNITRVLGAPMPPTLEARPVGRRGHPPAFYQEVAEVYRTSGGRKPVKRIAERFTVEDATARRWVRRARELGFLGKAIPGKAGEADEARGRPPGEREGKP